jgi:hypothetical protein
MGHPRPEDVIVPYSPEWWARFVAELTRLQTPAPAQLEERPRNEDPELAGEAERFRREAIEQGRATPRPAQPEQATEAATPESLEQYRQAGRERVRARVARVSEQSLEGADRGPK